MGFFKVTAANEMIAGDTSVFIWKEVFSANKFHPCLAYDHITMKFMHGLAGRRKFIRIRFVITGVTGGNTAFEHHDDVDE